MVFHKNVHGELTFQGTPVRVVYANGDDCIAMSGEKAPVLLAYLQEVVQPNEAGLAKLSLARAREEGLQAARPADWDVGLGPKPAQATTGTLPDALERAAEQSDRLARNVVAERVTLRLTPAMQKRLADRVLSGFWGVSATEAAEQLLALALREGLGL